MIKTLFLIETDCMELSYQLNKATSVQAGMMHQQVNDFGKWYLQFAIVFNTDLRKNKD